VPEKRKQSHFIGPIALLLGLAGSLYALLTLHLSEQAFRAADQEFRALRAILRETDPAAAAALIRPVREFEAPLPISAIITLGILLASMILFFIGGGLLVNKLLHAQKLARFQQIGMLPNAAYRALPMVGISLSLIGIVGAAFSLIATELLSFESGYSVERELSGSEIINVTILLLSLVVLAYGLAILSSRYRSQTKLSYSAVNLMTCSAICIALATVLSQVRLYRMPQGGSVTAFSMLFIVLVGYWFGAKAGLMAGVAYGLLRIMLGVTVVHPIQFILDYPAAFAALGCFGLFRGKRFGLQASYVAGVAGRFFCSFIAGVVFFGQFAGDQHVFVYSAVYQLTYMLPEALVTLVVISIPTVQNAIDRLTPVRKKTEAI
jgi:thiamine transporter